MPIADLQRAFRELGRIRMGVQVVKNGRSRPERLDTFRLTTPSQALASKASEVYGGTVRPWSSREGGPEQWEVITTASTLAVVIPPGAPLRQDYELWTAAGCARRCDGIGMTTGEPCQCPPVGPERAAAAASGTACKPTTRLAVVLPDVPDVGVWRLESHGYYAAVELAGSADLLRQGAEQGQMIPAVLRLEQRESKRPGQPTKNYAVPVLEIGVTMRALMSGPTSEPVPVIPAADAVPALTSAAGGPNLAAEAFARQAAAAQTPIEVKALGVHARERGLLDDLVDVGLSSEVSLGEYLLDRHRELSNVPAPQEENA